MSNKQSSVEWLLKELEEIGVLNIKNCHWSDEADIKKAIDQAKAMHKEEMQFCFNGGMSLVEGRLWKPMDLFDEFYNKKFGGNNDN